ncbi:MAG TPA: FMN-binding protein [Candidatus Limnocylindria bacterium]|nr:FMN-binding protein [Candidatus Limnocylindria bacterium]
MARARTAVALAGIIACVAAGPARSAQLTTQSQALAEAFPGARVERHAFVLDPAQVARVEGRARARLSTRVITAYAGWRGEALIGAAFFDRRTVRTMPGIFMVVVGPDTTVQRVEVLAFHEPPDYRPADRWLARFGGRPLDERLWPQRDLRNLAGATLSARAVTETVRLALALYETVAAPALAHGPRPEGR